MADMAAPRRHLKVSGCSASPSLTGPSRGAFMKHDIPAYGLWWLVVLNSAIFILFAFRFFQPPTKREWRSFGAFSAFIIALFTEMSRFPLTIYLLSGWLQRRYPALDWFTHDAGHLRSEERRVRQECARPCQ